MRAGGGAMWRWAILAAVLAAGAAFLIRPRPAVPAAVLATFRASGARPTGYSLNDWVTLSGPDSAAALTSRVIRVVRKAGCVGPVRVSRSYGVVRAVAACAVEGGRLRVEAEAVAGHGAYLAADEAVAGGLDAVSGRALALRGLLAPFGRVHATVTLEGLIRGLSGPTRDRRVIARMLVAGSAREVDAEAAGEWVSVSAYARGLGPAVVAG